MAFGDRIGQSIREADRQEKLQDDKFWKGSLPFLFELQVPKSLGGAQNSYLFPLVINPTDYEISEPFAAQLTPGEFGGLVADETGVLFREIRLEGHTGFQPRPYYGDTFDFEAPEQGRSYGRSIGGARPVKGIGFSGQRHFQFLQDSVFRTYGDLRKDRTTAEDTKMFFHVLKDDEHWRVVPRMFALRRTSADDGRVLYKYEIELWAVGPAQARDFLISEDKDWIDDIKDKVATVQRFIDTATGAVNDVIALVDELEGIVEDVGTLLSNVVNLVNVAADFVNGVTDLITAPFDVVTRLATELGTAVDNLENAVTSIPDRVENSFLQMEDAVLALGTHPEAFETESNRALRTLRDSSTLLSSAGIEALTSAAAEDAPNTLAAVLARGTLPNVGDLQKALGEIRGDPTFAAYESARPVEVRRIDTLESLAQREMGDARLWEQIAILNGLSAPYISTQGLPGTVMPGEELLIPSQVQPDNQRPVTAVVGAPLGAPPAEQVFGVDYLLVRDSQTGKFDWAIDARGTDVKQAKGIACVSQGLVTRLEVRKGSYNVYPTLGLDPVPKVGNQPMEDEMRRLRLAQALEGDPRVLTVRSVILNTSQPDTIDADISVELRAFSGEPLEMEVRP